jgi:hypothetical protein
VFAVYRQAGSIARMGEHPAVETPGVPLGPPVVTSTGTLWIHRPDNGQLCQLPLDAERLSCPAKTPLGHTGALTLIGDDQVAFVDTTGRMIYSVDDGGLGRQVRLPLADLPDDAIIAQNDVAGRVAILEPQQNVLHLIDTAELTSDKANAAPIRKQLRAGQYQRIASSGHSLALIDDRTDTLLTVDRDGNQKAERRIPPPSKKSKVGKGDRSGLFRGGDSRLYVASRSGEQVMVVEDTGDVTEVDTSAPRPDKPKTPKPDSKPTDKPSHQPVPPTTQPTEQPTQPPTHEPTDQPKPQDSNTNKPNDEPTGRPTDNEPSVEPSRPVQPPATNKPDPKPTVRASRPGAPRSVSGKAGTGSVLVSWEAAAPNGAPITSYRVTWTGGSRTMAASARSVNVTGLTNGTAYTFTVRAVNRVGTGPGTSTARLVPDGGAADAPPGFTAKAGDGRITISWKRPNMHGNTFEGYQYTATATSGSANSSTTQGTSHTFTDLDNGTSYRVTVRAITSDAKGNLIQGKAASRTITPGGGGSGSAASLTASRGASTTHGGGDKACDPPGCAFIKIVGRGLKPNTEYFFQPFTTEWQPSNTGATLTTESDGSILIDDRFATDAPGQQVWVVATADGEATVTSNKFNWRTS